MIKTMHLLQASLDYLRIMKTIFSLLFACVVGTTFGQSTIEFPYNPDSNGDGFIGVDDILQALSHFDTNWELPDQNSWATDALLNLIAFDNELDSTAQAISAQQAYLDSLATSVTCDMALLNSETCYLNFSSGTAHLDNYDCSTVLYQRNGGGGSKIIRLPTAACEGQGIVLVSLNYSGQGSQGQPLSIQAWDGNNWIDLASMQYGGQVGGLGIQAGPLRFFHAIFTNGMWAWDQSEAVSVSP